MTPIADASFHDIAWALLKTHWGQEIKQARATLLARSPDLLERPDLNDAGENLIRMGVALASRMTVVGKNPVLELLWQNASAPGRLRVREVELAQTDLENAIEINKRIPFKQYVLNEELNDHAQAMRASVDSIPSLTAGEPAPRTWESQAKDPMDFHRGIWVEQNGTWLVIDGTHRMQATAYECVVEGKPWPDLRAWVVDSTP